MERLETRDRVRNETLKQTPVDAVYVRAITVVRVSYHPVRGDSSLQEAGEDIRGMMAVV